MILGDSFKMHEKVKSKARVNAINIDNIKQQ